jgi:hypothetical protein
MNDHESNVERVFDLAGSICDECASENDFIELDSIIVADDTSGHCYWDYCRMHVLLGMEASIHRALQSVRERDKLNPAALTPWESDVLNATTPTTEASLSSTAFGFLSATFDGTLGYLSSGWPVAYLIATVIFGIGAVIAAFTYVSQPEPMAREMPMVAQNRAVSPMHNGFVGRITNVVDCRWADSSVSPVASRVTIGQKYSLASGLMEITYDTGAKVILQGPATYDIQSRNSGFLSTGQLFGKVEVEAAKGFSVRTPTAMVTDLGTEFGIKVTNDGACEIHVIRGTVRADRISQTSGKLCVIGDEPPLTAGQAVRFTASQPGRIWTKMDARCFKTMQTELSRDRSSRLWPVIDKTLVAWVALANTDQRGSGVLSIAESPEFDGIVFGEIEPKRWMAGSHNYFRTSINQRDFAAETASSKEFVQIAIVYQGWTITIYRNGEEYTQYTADNRRFFNKRSVVLIGKRHPDVGGATPPTLQGVVKEARLYNVSLTPSEIASLEPGKPSKIAPIGLWAFENGTTRDATGHFPPGELHGNAQITDGQLILDGNDSYLLIPSATELKTASPETATTRLGKETKPQTPTTTTTKP